MKVPFFRSTITGDEQKYIAQVTGDSDSFFQKKFIQKCESWFLDNLKLNHFALTKSCTHSLELAALLLDIKADDEVIMPSFGFVSCANAFALRGATCVFVDVYPDSMNIDDTKIEAAITPKTKAIVTINYLGVVCNYEAISLITEKHNLYIIEDNAHGTGAKYLDRPLGSFGHISTFSFDHLKSINSGQGGGIAVNDPALLERFYIHYEFGTNRRAFQKGEHDRYEWKGLGSNYPISELNAAMLFAQLENIEKINKAFLTNWIGYKESLSGLFLGGKIAIYEPGVDFAHCGYSFFIKAKDKQERTSLIEFLGTKGINAQFHYTPLHTSDFGQKVGRQSGICENTIKESERLLRLPLYYDMKREELDYVISSIREYYS